MAMAHKNACPCCRAKLIDVGDDDDDDEQPAGAARGGSAEEADNDGGSDLDDEGDVEDIVARLEREGLTLLDVVSMLLNRYSRRDEKYTNEHIGHINRRFDQLAAEVDMEHIEAQHFAREDHRGRGVEVSHDSVTGISVT